MLARQSAIDLLRNIQRDYEVLGTICPFDDIDRAFVKAHLDNESMVTAIRSIWQSNKELENLLSQAAVDASQIIPGIDEELYDFYHNVVKPRHAKMFGLWSATQDIDLYDLFADIDIQEFDAKSERIKNIFLSGVDYWELQLPDGNPDDYDESEINDAFQVIFSQYFDPDGWLQRSRELKPILLKDWNYQIPKALSKRLKELYLCYLFGNWLATISLSRAVLEFAMLDRLKRLGVDVSDTNDKARTASLERLISLTQGVRPVSADELHYIRKWGNAVMHPEPSDRISEYTVRKRIAKTCIERLIRGIEGLYR